MISLFKIIFRKVSWVSTPGWSISWAWLHWRDVIQWNNQSVDDNIYMLPLMGWALKWGIAGCHICINAKLFSWIELSGSVYVKKIYLNNSFAYTENDNNFWVRYLTDIKLEAFRMSSHTEELWYNKRVCLWMTIVTWSPTERGEIKNVPYPSVFRLAGHQRLTVKEKQRMWVNFGRPLKEGKKMWVRLSVLHDLTRVAWQGKEDDGSQMIGWDPKMEVAPSSRQRKKEIRKLVLDQTSSWPDGVKRMPRLWDKKDGNILDKKDKEPYLQARLQK